MDHEPRRNENATAVVKGQGDLMNGNLWDSVLIGLITGFLSSTITLAGDRYLRRSRLKAKLRRLVGNYDIYNFKGEPESGDVVVSLKVTDWNTITTEAIGDHHWKGQITFNESTPEYGLGIYRYLVHPENLRTVGTHRMQYNPLDDTIHVIGSSMTRDTKFAYILRRRLSE